MKRVEDRGGGRDGVCCWYLGGEVFVDRGKFSCCYWAGDVDERGGSGYCLNFKDCWPSNNF